MKYEIKYTGEESFFKCFKIQGKKILPFSALIELIKAAGSKVNNQIVKNTFTIRNFSWNRLITIENEPIGFIFELWEENEGFSFELYQQNDNFNKTVYALGKVLNTPKAIVSRIEVEHLVNEENLKVNKKEFYKELANNSLEYADKLQSIDSVFQIQNQLWSKLIPQKEEEYELPLNIVESVFQTIKKFKGNTNLRIESIETTHIYDNINNTKWCQVIKDTDNYYTANLLNIEGEILLTFEKIKLISENSFFEIQYFEDTWEEIQEINYSKKPFQEKKIICLGEENELACKFKNAMIEQGAVVTYLSHIEDIIESFDHLFIFPNCSVRTSTDESIEYGIEEKFIFQSLKKLLKLTSNNFSTHIITTQTQQVFSSCKIKEKGAGIFGLVGTVASEIPTWNFRVVDINENELIDFKELTFKIVQASETLMVYRNGSLYKKLLNPINELSTVSYSNKIRQNGTYIILGGAGGLGKITTKHLIEKYNAKIYWLGRRPLDKSVKTSLNEFSKYKNKPVYFQCNANELADVQAFFKQIKLDKKNINGIIHSALVLEDKSFHAMSFSDFSKAFAPKSIAVQNLVMVFKNEPLDFMCFYSSIQGFFNGPGQANYAAGCTYKNTFAKVIEQKYKIPTYTINWGYWGYVGVVSDSKYADRMHQMGIGSIEEAEGMVTLEKILASKKNEIYAIKFSKKTIAKSLMSKIKNTSQNENTFNPEKKIKNQIGIEASDKEDYYYLVLDKVQLIAASLIKLSKDELDIEEPFSTVGYDSILSSQLTEKLNKELNINLQPTDLFNYPTIRLLTQFIIENKKDWKNQLIEKKEVIKSPILIKQSGLQKEEKIYSSTSSNEASLSSIAIVGMSGAYAGTSNLEEYWEALKAGESLVKEVPTERWDSTVHYSSIKGERDKTYSKWGGFMDRIDEFDAGFFKISGREAENMDPQQRLFLEHCWHALEDANLTADHIDSKQVGVYAGVGNSDYIQDPKDKHVSVFWGMDNSILAARISYYLNLRGPALAIDSACSSSLVALEMACRNLQTKNIDMGICGGVSLSSTPLFHKMASKAGMLSEDGQCFTFDHRANGFVPGEGVGVVVVKRLEDAIKDDDNIYAVVKGILTNQDGATNGILAPSALSQEALEKQVYETFKIDPETISYVEAHGTGTKLGDPIEIEALTKSFRSKTLKKQYCGIGSVKTNIGHTLHAAGVAGLQKIVLSMRYKKIPPSLNYQENNDLIDFENSPFYVNRSLKTWDDYKGDRRRAAISSFGFSGTNAHAIIEEYIPNNLEKLEEGNKTKVIIPISAKDKNSLKRYCKRLLSFVNDNSKNTSMISLAYTFQVGRTEMEERFACVIENKEELILELESFLDQKHENGIQKSSKFYTNNIRVKENSPFIKSISGKIFIESAIKNSELEIIAELWTQGGKIDWELLYSQKVKKIKIPLYPFERDCYWIDEKMEPLFKRTLKIHPLIHQNVSTLRKQKFVSNFDGSEYFIKDHIVNGSSLFPGAAYIEMAREAGEISTGFNINECYDIIWQKPLRANEKWPQLHTQISEAKNLSYQFEIFSNKGDKKVIHSIGKLRKNLLNDEVVERFNIDKIKSKLTKYKSKKEIYSHFSDLGFDYGSNFQGIQNIRYSHNRVLVELSFNRQDQFVLEPGMLDSVFQSSIGLSLEGKINTIYVPYSLKRLSVYDKLPTKAWCIVDLIETKSNTSNIRKYNMILINGLGKCILKLDEFTLLPLENIAKEDKTKESEIGVQYFDYTWKNITSDKIKPIESKQLVYIAGFGNAIEENKKYSDFEVKAISDQYDPISAFQFIFNELKQIVASKDKIQIALVIEQDKYHQYGHLSAFLKSVQLEYSKVSSKIIVLSSLNSITIDEVLQIVESERMYPSFEVRYINGKREEKVLEAFIPQKETSEVKIKEGGVYWLTGGMGGLGQIFLNHILNVNNTKVILTGRSPINDDYKKILKVYKNAIYSRCDISDKNSVELQFQQIKEQFKKIDGVLHGAGVIKDRFLIHKNIEEAKEVLKPKIEGIQFLDEVTKDEKLDFFVSFSAVAAITGNQGQSDYASANAFMDNYIAYRESKHKKNERFGKSISINWPLWEKGGMKMSQDKKEYLKNLTGMLPMPNEIGTNSFDFILSCGNKQMMPVYGLLDKIRIQNTVAKNIVNTDNRKGTKEKEYDQKTLEEFITSYLIELLSEEFKLPKERFELHKYFEDFGIDSISITKLTNTLDEVFDDIPRTLFFEHQTLNELIEYFIEDQQEALEQLMLKRKDSIDSECNPEVVREIPERGEIDKKRQDINIPIMINNSVKQEDFSLSEKANDEEKIAIVGLSGKYPGANNIEEFWENLKNGKDSVTEIPKDRWDLGSFYDDEKGKTGKSYSKWGGFIEDVDKFDPLFFKISPREAEIMEPQERLFLQTAWETIEDAGYTRDGLRESTQANDLKGNIGVFVGVMYEEYQLYGIEEQHKGNQINLVGNPSSIANRVSYFFNFHGPSMALDTMCSSSITAVELACQSILNGDCKAAIAGGVNVSIHPNKYLLLSKAGFASSTGRCKSFGEGGDGYVPSEGVGAVLLKKLSEAERDGDQIYGIIRGASLNHGGKTNGYTVPNPKAQASVIKTALKKANLQANEISYIEAHGTGTSLGDPIEIASLKKAFQVKDKNFLCKIGSVKSNIGHCESAAGISGITKVLLQLKNKQLAPSIHAEVQNPNINFNNTPFRVQKVLEPWGTNKKPRIAGISSFGAGGSNAHLIIEEYNIQKKIINNDSHIPLWILSAKSEKQLKEYAEKLLRFIRTQEKKSPQNIAYTLQVGREAMTHRLAFYAITIEEGISELSSFLNGTLLNYHYGVEDVELLKAENTTDIKIESLNKNRDQKLLKLWCSGLMIEWSKFYNQEELPQKISLPTYPFLKKRCWFPKGIEVNETLEKTEIENRIHPLLHKNISDLYDIKFQSNFYGNETFLTDHVIKSEKLFPGVAYIELARKALEETTHKEILQLKNITWLKPLKVENGITLVNSIVSKKNKKTIVQVSSIEEGEIIVHAEIELGEEELKQPLKQNISLLKERMKNEKDGRECYEAFKTIGLEYGTTFKGIKNLYFNKSESLVSIGIPIHDDLLLQPGVLDTALQATIGVDYDNKKGGVQLPYNIENFHIYSTELSKASWCYVQKYNEESIIDKYLIQILDSDGNILIEIKNFVSIPLGSVSGDLDQKNKAEDKNAIGMYYQSIWEKTLFNESSDISTSKNNAFIGKRNDYTEVLEKELQVKDENVSWYNHVNEIPIDVKTIYFLQGLWNSDNGKDILEQIDEIELSIFDNVKALQKRSVEKLELIFVTKQTQKVIHSDIVTKKGAGIVGFVGSLIKEELNWVVKNIDILLPNDMKNILHSPYSEMGESLAIRNNNLYKNVLIPVEDTVVVKKHTKIRKGGVYIILGGAGGLGKITTSYLVKEYQAKVYWLGRREQDEAITQSIKEIAKYGLAPTYIQCDASSKLSIQSAYIQIKLTSEEINGIFHSAIVLNDKVITNMNEKDFTKSFYPKSIGSQNFIEIFNQEELDFICFYSSAQSFFRAAGQSNYSAGCTYKDSLANEINQTTGIPTYIIHWGYWGGTGIVSSKDYENRMQQMGIGSINEREGMQSLEKVFTQQNRQLFVMKFLNDAVIKRMKIFQLKKRVMNSPKNSKIKLKRIELTTSKKILN